MKSRLDLRPTIETEEFEECSDEEKFQNRTLRPILKLQNELLLAIFEKYTIESKNEFCALTTDQKIQFIENSLQKDIVLTNKLIGVVLGMFTIEEMTVYSADANLYNKRIRSLLIERIRSQVGLL